MKTFRFLVFGLIALIIGACSANQPTGYEINATNTAAAHAPTATPRPQLPPEKRGFLGVSLGDAPNSSGALIVKIVPGSLAERTKIAVGDVITQVGDKQIQTANDAVDALSVYSPGESFHINLLRGDQTYGGDIKLDPLPTTIPPTNVPPTSAPTNAPTVVPPTAVPPTATQVPTDAPTTIPPTNVPPTSAPTNAPTVVPPTATPIALDQFGNPLPVVPAVKLTDVTTKNACLSVLQKTIADQQPATIIAGWTCGSDSNWATVPTTLIDVTTLAGYAKEIVPEGNYWHILRVAADGKTPPWFVLIHGQCGTGTAVSWTTNMVLSVKNGFCQFDFVIDPRLANGGDAKMYGSQPYIDVLKGEGGPIGKTVVFELGSKGGVVQIFSPEKDVDNHEYVLNRNYCTDCTDKISLNGNGVIPPEKWGGVGSQHPVAHDVLTAYKMPQMQLNPTTVRMWAKQDQEVVLWFGASLDY